MPVVRGVLSVVILQPENGLPWMTTDERGVEADMREIGNRSCLVRS